MTPNKEATAKCVKQLTNSASPKVMTLDRDGKRTYPGKETCKALLQAHYSSMVEKECTTYDFSKRINVEELLTKYQDWINIEKLMKVLIGFLKKKSPGPDTCSPAVSVELPRKTLDLLITISLHRTALHTNYLEILQDCLYTQTRKRSL